jgi:hypothetical protein
VKTIRAMGAYHMDYSRVAAPSLAIYADRSHYPGGEDGISDAKRRELERWWRDHQRPRELADIAQFRREAQHGEIVELRGAEHYLFLGATQADGAERARAFLLQESR